MKRPTGTGVPKSPLHGKTCLVTGANSGIGKATALGLASMGANMVLVCRDRLRGERAKTEIVEKTANVSIELLIADLSYMREVRRVAAEFMNGHSGLDVLVNNAGSNFPTYAETEEGFERTMALNYFSPFLLTNLLLPSLKAAAPSRVVNVASVSHFQGELDLADINGRDSRGMFGLRAYQRSKLALVLFTYELARRLQGGGITVNCMHPGAVRTRIWAHGGAMTPLAMVASMFMRRPEKGAETLVYLASSPEVDGVTGKYFVDKRARPSSNASHHMAMASGLWDLSAKLTSLSDRS